MSDKSAIEWTDATWNPIRGCSRVSEGCTRCYAEAIASRFSGPGLPYEGLARSTPGGPRWTGEVRLIERQLDAPLRWKEPRRIFVNSMSDLFHEKLSHETIDRVFHVMSLARRHTFQILTKRPERMRAYMKRLERSAHGVPGPIPLPNVWLGVSCEHQAAADERIPLLLQTPAAVRFISAEPLLGPIDLRGLNVDADHEMDALEPWSPREIWDRCWSPEATGVAMQGSIEAFEEEGHNYPPSNERPRGIDWVIVGGESGPDARPMHPAWARSLRDQCQSSGTAFFLKQWGAWQPVRALYDDGEHEHLDDGRGELLALELDGYLHVPNGPLFQPAPAAWLVERVGKHRAGRQLDGREWNDFPSTETGR